MADSDLDATVPRCLSGGRYAVTALLGSGGQGRTLDGLDTHSGCSVAIKQFIIRGAREWKDVELAEREAQVLATIAHPRLPVYIDHFEENGSLFLVTQKIEGEPLGGPRAKGARLGQDDLRRLLRDMSAALEYLHSRVPPIIHRDVKPSNIIRGSDGSFSLVDFGSVRDRLRSQGGSTMVGTFGYMAPEQLQGRAMAATDVYSLGVTVLQLATGMEPELLPHQGLAIDVKASLAQSLPVQWISLLERMVLPDPDLRLSSISAELAGLDAAARGAPQNRASQVAGDAAAAPAGRHEPRRDKERRSWRMPPSHAPNAVADEILDLIAQLPARMPVSLLLSVARVFVSVALCALLPSFLVLLSLVFGPALRRAAAAVSRSGQIAESFLGEATARVHERSQFEPRSKRRGFGGKTRVGVPSDPRRHRVDSQRQDAADDSESEWPPGRGRRRNRR